MEPTKLTMRTVEALRQEAQSTGKAQWCWDTELRGFGARAAPSGRVTWQFQHWIGGVGGRPNRLAFAHYPPTKLHEARAQAEKLRGEANGGVDVVSRKKQRRQAQREALRAIKLGDAAERYAARNAKPGSYWTEVKRKFDREIIPALGRDTPLAGITRAEIIHLIDIKEQTHPIAARYMFAVLRPFFSWCVSRQFIEASPLKDLTAPPASEARDRILSDDELRAFWKATADMLLFGPFYRLLLLTAQRREEVAAMEWGEIDTPSCTWTIPGERTKNGKEHIVHLSPQAMMVLNGIRRLQSDYVFTTTLTTPISGYGRAKARLDDLVSAAKPWRVHDLRRTAASGMAKLGFQPHVIERVLNHVSGAQGGLVGVYQRYEYLEERKRAIEAWGSYVESLVAAEDKLTNVVRIPLKTA